MSKRNHDGDEKLLIWGLILTFTGIASGIGITLLVIYGIKKAVNSKRFFDNINNVEEKINYKFSKEVNEKKVYSYNNQESNEPKIIYAEKVETVNNEFNKKPVQENVKSDSANTAKTNSSEEFSTQDILDKLDYYEEHQDLNNDEILEKITLLNKMLLSLAPRIDKIELQNDIKDINKIIEKIVKTLKKKKSKIKKVNNFTAYYLPVTLKILIKYDEIENLRLNTSNSKEFMESVEEKMKMIKQSFNTQLESLYADDFDDVEAELNVLETMLKSDGYTDIDDFNLRKKDNG